MKKRDDRDHTLSVHEVVNQDIVSGLLLQGSVVEQLLVDNTAHTRILLAESTDVAIDGSSVLDKTRIPRSVNPHPPKQDLHLRLKSQLINLQTAPPTEPC